MILFHLFSWFLGGGSPGGGSYRAAAGQVWVAGAAEGELHAD